MAAAVGGRLIVHLKRNAEALVFAGAAFSIAATALFPLVFVSGDLLRTPAEFLRSIESLGARNTWMLLLISLMRAGAVTAAALVLGVPLGFLFARTNLPGRRCVFALQAFPMVLPPFLLALGWFQFFGRGGFWGGETSSRMLFGEMGAVTIQVLAFTPIITSLVFLGLHAVDPSLEDAARMVASPIRTARKILLPLIWPSAALSALVVFALSLSELGVPTFLRVRGYPAMVFSRLGGIDYAPGEAVALVLPLLVIALGLLVLERRLVPRRTLAAIGIRMDRTGWPLGRWRPAATAFGWFFAGAAILPILGLALRAARGGGFAKAPQWIGASVQNSLVPALAAATIAVAIGVVLGRSIGRGRRGARPLDAVQILAFIAPAAILGIGLIGVWNRPATQLIYGSTAIIAIGYVARYGVIATRTVAAAVAQGSPHFEEAAAVHGGGFLRRLLRIVLPVHAKAVVAAWLLTLVFCLRDLDTAILFYPPGSEPLPVRIFTLEANGPEAIIGALAFIHVLLTASVLSVAAILLLWSRAR